MQGTQPPVPTIDGIWEMTSAKRRWHYPQECIARLTIRSSSATVFEDVFCPEGTFYEFREYARLGSLGVCQIDLRTPTWWNQPGSHATNEYCLSPNSAFTLLEGDFWVDFGAGWPPESWPNYTCGTSCTYTPKVPVQFHKIAELPPS